MRAALVSALLVAACNVPEAPNRSDNYPFQGPTGEVFSWPDSIMPVRIWAEDRGPNVRNTLAALLLWENQFLYREFRGTIWHDSSTAEIQILLSGTVPDIAINGDSPVRACAGATGFTLDNGRVLRMIVQVTGFAGFADQDIANCVFRTTAHELGHALGLLNLGHVGTDASDLMFGDPQVSAASNADRNTIQILYHTEPNLEAAGR